MDESTHRFIHAVDMNDVVDRFVVGTEALEVSHHTVVVIRVVPQDQQTRPKPRVAGKVSSSVRGDSLDRTGTGRR